MFPRKKSRKCFAELLREIIKAAAFVPARTIAAVFLFMFTNFICEPHFYFHEFSYLAFENRYVFAFVFEFEFTAPVKSIF